MITDQAEKYPEPADEMKPESRLHKKRHGIFYTPEYIIDFIVDHIIPLYLKETHGKADQIKILDPSCGAGYFLLNTLKKMRKIYELDNFDVEYIDRNILLNNLFGVDLDPAAVETAKFDLILESNIEKNKVPDLSSNIKHGNSLIDDIDIGKSETFIWEKEFPVIMENGGFDIIIGNPPWVSIKGKQKVQGFSEEMLIYLLNKYPCDKYRPNLFEIFIWRCLDLLKEGGFLGFIVPDRICSNIQFKNLRENILKNCKLKYLWFRPIFEHIYSDNIVFILKKEKPDDGSAIAIAEYPHIKFKKVLQSTFLSLSEYRWQNVNEKISNIFLNIMKRPYVFHLSERFQTGTGFIGVKSEITNIRKDDSQIKILKGENISRFSIHGGFYFNFIKKNLLGGTWKYTKLSRKPKVLIRKTGDSIFAAFDSDGIVPEQSLYFVLSKENNENEILILSAILNSPVIDCYFKNFAITNKNITPQLKKSDLDRFPIIIPEDKELPELIKSLYFMVKNQKKEKDDIEIKKLIVQINKLIFRAYNLKKDEIDIINNYSI